MTSVLFPIFLLIAVGFGAARMRVVGTDGVRALSDFAFMLFLPALLFRSMARTDFAAFPLLAPTAYFGVAVPVYLAGYWWLRRRGLAAAAASVFSIAGVYSNLVMLGVPLVGIAFGDAGLAVLLSVIALHSLVMLTTATLVMEYGERAGALGAPGAPGSTLRVLRAIGEVARAALLHPVILPILAGVVWGLTGWQLPEAIDSTLALIGSAAPTLCLILLGASLGHFDPRAELGAALRLTVMKSLVHPALMYLAGRFVFGLDPLPLAVLTLTASAPVGANAYLLAQRYAAGQGAVSAAVTLSTIATGLIVGPLLALLVP